MRWLIDNQTAVALNPDDGVHPGANLEVTVQAADEHSNLRQVWAQVDGDDPAPPTDNDRCPGLETQGQQTFSLQAPMGIDGQAFNLRAGAFDDVGAGSDHNTGLAIDFPLQINDDISPNIGVIAVLNAAGQAVTPDLSGTLRLAVTASDTFGKIARLQLRIEDQTGSVASEGDVEILDPSATQLSAYASPTVLQLPNPNDRRATANWSARVTLWDDASPPNPSSLSVPFLPRDTQTPNLTQVAGGGSINLSNGRVANVTISGNDTARYVASVGLVELQVGQSTVSNQAVSTNLPANSASASNVGVSIAIPTTAKEAVISALPSIVDDSGNVTTGNRVSFNLVDNVPPIGSAVFNPNILVPGGPVRLEVTASDINSVGIARIAVANLEHVTWTSQSVSNQNSMVFLGTVTENPGNLGAGVELIASVTLTDRAAAGNQRVITAAANLRDEAGPIITVTEVSDGPTGSNATLRIQARDISGVVASTGYTVTIDGFNTDDQTPRSQTVSYLAGQRLSTQSQTFMVSVPDSAEEGQYTIVFSATDGEGNLTQFTTTGNLRLNVVDQSGPTNLIFVSLPDELDTGENSSIRVRARDNASGIATLRLRAQGAGIDQTFNHNCNSNVEQCTHTFSLPIGISALHGDLVTFTLTAIDNAGANNSTQLGNQPTRAINDVDSPINVAITNLAPVQVNTGTTLRITASAHDESSGLARIDFSVPCGSAAPVVINDAPRQPMNFFSDWQIPEDCSTVGSQNISISVRDVAGNPVTSASLNLNIVDAEPPTVSFLNPPSSINTGQSLNIDLRISDAGSGAASVTLSSTCGSIDNAGSQSINGAPSSSDQSFVLSGVENCPPGNITLSAGGQDVAGNSAVTVTRVLTLNDTVAPETALASSSMTIDVGTSVTLTATLRDRSSGLISASFSVPCGSIAAVHPLVFNGETSEQIVQRSWTIPANCRTLGSLSVTLTASDDSADSADGSDSISVTLRDQTLPTVAWDNPASDVNLSTGISLSADASDQSSGIASLSFALTNNAQGSFNPTTRTPAGAPTNTNENSFLTVDSSLLHGAQVEVRVTAQDLAGNSSTLDATTTLNVIDDVSPTAIIVAATLAADRDLGGNRFAVAAAEDVSLELSATDEISGFATLWLAVSAGDAPADAAGNGVVNFSTTVQYHVPDASVDGAEITLTPSADDTSDAGGFVAGSAIVLVVDRSPPNANATLTSPSNANSFGQAQSFGCLGAADTVISGASGATDAARINVAINPLPAGFPPQGQYVTVNNQTWTLSPAGFTWENQTEYTVTLRAQDAVGNLQIVGASFTLRGDTVDGTWAPVPSFSNTSANALSGRANYQPVMSDFRSATNGGSMLVVGSFDCGSQNEQADSSPEAANFTITETSTVSLGQNCDWQLRESFCSRIRSASGTTSFSKPNAAPILAGNQQIEGSNDASPTLENLWPAMSGVYNDSLDANTNQIAFSSSVEFEVYNNAGVAIWNNGGLALGIASGGSAAANFPFWRPPSSGVSDGDGSAKRGGKELFWFGRGNNPNLNILDLERNVWTDLSESRIGGEGPVTWSENDDVMMLPSGEWLRVTASGTHLIGDYDGANITWDNLGTVIGIPSFPACSSVRLSTLGSGSGRALLWCRSSAQISVNRLTTYLLSEPIGMVTEWTTLNIANSNLSTVDEDFQVARLGSSDDYRIIPTSGGNVDPLGARLDPGGFTPSWTTAPTGTGQSLTLGSGCSIASRAGNSSYIVLDGDSDGWMVSADADPSSDSFSALVLPAGLSVNGAGQHLSAGSTEHGVVALSWHNTHGLRPIMWIAAESAFAAPPDPANDEEALSHGQFYSWDLRFTDEGGLSGLFGGAGNRQTFTISIP
ncbi:MAG: hypothetical protein OSB21_03455 [Myxococcota bacterium]|nr:hypothetical protein [Myxococcota bacterium]